MGLIARYTLKETQTYFGFKTYAKLCLYTQEKDTTLQAYWGEKKLWIGTTSLILQNLLSNDADFVKLIAKFLI